MKRGIFIGRFQPIHIGHMDVISEMNFADDLSEIVIGIGSSQVSHTMHNPFTAGEREEMIRDSLDRKMLRKPYHLVRIPDTNDFSSWVQSVLEICRENNCLFDVVYSGNTVVKDLFEKTELEVRTPAMKRRTSATDVRKAMLADAYWEDLVPEAVKDFMNQNEGLRRIREISTQYMNCYVTADVIINYYGLDQNHTLSKGIVLIKRRKEPFLNFWALPGGHFDAADNCIEEAALREIKEETGLELRRHYLNLLSVYSQSGRDPRGPTITTVYYAETGQGTIKAGDDAKEIGIFQLHELPKKLAFDHRQILEDYHRRVYGG